MKTVAILNRGHVLVPFRLICPQHIDTTATEQHHDEENYDSVVSSSQSSSCLVWSWGAARLTTSRVNGISSRFPCSSISRIVTICSVS
jgi:hypothetical protein